MGKLVLAVFSAFFLLFITYIGLSVVPTDALPTADRERLISGNLTAVAGQMWSFVKPLLQLAFIVLIFEYAVNKFSDRKLPQMFSQLSDVRAIIAVVVVMAFSIAALSGSESAGLLKDVALVVIGFYFGGKKEAA